MRNVRIYIDTYYDERNMKNRPITQRVRVSYKIQFNFFPSFFFSLFIHTFKACSSGVENLFNQYLSLFFFFLVTNRHLRYYQTLFKHSKGAIVSRTYKFIRSIHLKKKFKKHFLKRFKKKNFVTLVVFYIAGYNLLQPVLTHFLRPSVILV